MATKAELEQQEAQCKSVDDFVNLANQALNEPADTGYAKTLDDFIKLAKAAKQHGDEQAARTFYGKAARHCSDVAATVAYAKGMVQLFGDEAAAKKILDDAETDCQFTKQFVELASAYKA